MSHTLARWLQVKFREEGQLEVLDRARHSGGEKSVSTIMFLLSLQKITATPFRVVDEINQGMDATNERKVFQVGLVLLFVFSGTSGVDFLARRC